MNPLEEPVDEPKLREFFGRNKTEMSCMDNPQTFLNKLIPEEKYKEMTRITSQDEMRENLYTFLCWIEEERPETIKLFCTCVFKEFLVTRYPTLKRLRDILIDGSLPNRENAEIGTLASNRLPVTCGDKQGTLYRDKLEKGEPCIRSSKKLLTPMEFEKLGGKHSSKNWKQSILHQGTPLKKLFKVFKRKAKP